MNSHEEPMVSVLTPVYNGESFLAECIESVLGQTYRNYEYIIVNNCSTDGTLEIAEKYSRLDSRIRVYTNETFVGVIANHNIAFSLISPSSKYCKVVSADDFIFPNCIARMIQVANSEPSIGIVGSYQLSGSRVRWQGFQYPKNAFSGHEICRRVFLGTESDLGFGSPTSIMYRSDLVRDNRDFYPNPSPHSDTSTCFRDLQGSNFGFVHEILSYERTHGDTQTTQSADINRYSSAYLSDLILYGPYYLNETELQSRITEELWSYQQFLAINYFFSSRDDKFWTYHKGRLEELGHPLTRATLIASMIKKALRELSNPGIAIAKARKRFFSTKASNISLDSDTRKEPTIYRTSKAQ